MVPAGYMAKRLSNAPPTWLQAPAVRDVYSVSDCVNDNLVGGDPSWPINGYWLFDSIDAMKAAAAARSVDLTDAWFFYYEACDLEFDEGAWIPFTPDSHFETHVIEPGSRELHGYDVVATGDGHTSHSPLSCNHVAEEVHTNAHCLFDTIDEARSAIEQGKFEGAEPGPYRIYAVHTVTSR